MAEEAKRVTILNQREGKIVLAPDPDELKANPLAKPRILFAGQAIEVSEEEAAKLIRYKGLVDASKLVSGDSSQVKALKAQLAAAQADNLKLKEAAAKSGAGDDGDSETDDVDNGVLDAKKGVACTLPDGKTGVIVYVNKAKGTAKVKRDDNGNVSEFAVADLKPAPAEVAA